ncbi:MAG: mechanosensitive ion channel family protein [Bacteroidetes bacterium]|nr:mechanosensitive ion channel family protein [Bacteroidota bacterium]MBK9414513.1 mechanosensitive ion channel family protein [Bacteroidota bacterium]MBP6426561.1 mechanosensitive ion channel family protein [Bacteroidia bacterium]MBP6657272.1 mechanosensitive ion channel family protein [Bacteroidia bacterium]MBP9193008.1 mechanosensitive ion channel family protein [Ignavibacteria bacterium]
MEEIFLKWTKMAIPWLLTHGVKIILIALGAYILSKLANKSIEKVVRVAVVSDRYLSKQAEEKREDTLIRIFSWTSRIIIMMIAILMILQELGISVGPILAGLGIIGLAVGFGGQYLIRDIISGFFIILENQYRIGDVVNFDGTGGLVEDISLRLTTLRDLDGTVHHVPHGEIKKVANLSKDFARVNLNIGVSYNSKLDHVIQIVNRAGLELSQDSNWKEFIIKAPQFLRVDEFADSSIIIKILGETQALKQWDVTGELRKRIKVAFDKEGIEIPFPQRVVHHPQ